MSGGGGPEGALHQWEKCTWGWRGACTGAGVTWEGGELSPGHATLGGGGLTVGGGESASSGGGGNGGEACSKRVIWGGGRLQGGNGGGERGEEGNLHHGEGACRGAMWGEESILGEVTGEGSLQEGHLRGQEPVSGVISVEVRGAAVGVTGWGGRRSPPWRLQSGDLGGREAAMGHRKGACRRVPGGRDAAGGPQDGGSLDGGLQQEGHLEVGSPQRGIWREGTQHWGSPLRGGARLHCGGGAQGGSQEGNLHQGEVT